MMRKNDKDTEIVIIIIIFFWGDTLKINIYCSFNDNDNLIYNNIHTNTLQNIVKYCVIKKKFVINILKNDNNNNKKRGERKLFKKFSIHN
ncbi:hypothetical protein DERF_014957 [Dermatophagoides farinae]|uniref:Uncharacterized protein n=1 Tax=Dermatophagoides farinae TaxID=6954 RepID=A0A922L1S1_DERFA|nr:hypothetical protein DERF_014957 [Dermatophagoides farinae]